MTTKVKNIVVACMVAIILLGVAVFCWVKPTDDYSLSERRPLADFPVLSWDSILSGRFMTEFEDYTLDQFPLRESLRTVKALTAFYGFGQQDNNGIYFAEGHLSKLEYPMHTQNMEHAAKRFRYIYEKYLAGTDTAVYFSIIPDKNYFLAEKSGHPSLDYAAFFSKMQEETDFMEYISITDTLTLEDYYRTDTHWRQEQLPETAKKLAAGMGVTLTASYQVQQLDTPFYGVYYGQAALPFGADHLAYLTNAMLEQYVVYDFENNRAIPVYNMEKAVGDDPYEMFLSGSLSLLTIENPNAVTDKELILFRDSFGSSIAPLLAEGYAKVTLVDIRYLAPELLERHLTFTNQDVLFLYSTSVLNNGNTIK